LFDWIWSDKIRVLAYHDVRDGAAFEKQIHYLKKHYSIISLKELTDHFEKGASLPLRPLLITFDDGDTSVYDSGLAVLEKHGVPAVLFIITELIGTRKAFWWKKIEKHYTGKGQSFAQARQQVTALKVMDNAARLSVLSSLEDVAAMQLTQPQLKELAAKGVSIANHSHTHPMFNRCTAAEISFEMQQSKLFFQEFNPGYFEVFAYPNGNFDAATEDTLMKAGIRYAFLFDHKLNSMTVNPMRISRIRVNTDHDLPEFRVRVSGFHRLIARVQ
jgi:peptidoglycan/xylan/chitin deacetylase (PgdA/CDA1 family)